MTTMIEEKVEKIGKLLILAERTDNEAEQNAFFEAAQRLASQYSVELEVARQAVTNKEKRETPTNKHIQIGERGKPLNATFCSLFMGIGRAQDLKFNIAHNSTYVIAFGFPTDIAITEAMYAHISIQMVEMANAFIKKGEWKTDTTWDEKTWSYKPVHARVARRCFYEAFTQRVGSRLMAAKHEAEASIVVPEASTSTELVIRGKQLDVSDFYKQKSTARGSWRGGNNTYHSSTGSSAGARAGDNARLGGQRGITGGKKAIQ